MISDFILRALLGGVGVAAIAGPLGAFVVWRRLAFFGDSLSHSALLGVALGFLLGISLNLSVMIVCIAVTSGFLYFQQKPSLPSDTVLGILAHSSLALGLVLLSFAQGLRVDLLGYLFGDILAVTQQDLWLIYTIALITGLALWFLWRDLLLITINENIAAVEGVSVTRVKWLFMLLMALVVALAMKIVGVLLITALLIIPAATARQLSRTPLQMALLASFIGAISVIAGVYSSLLWDIPTGPAIVVSATLFFILSNFTTFLKKS